MRDKFFVARCAATMALALCAAVLAARPQAPEKFTNLQYFPKDIPRAELIGDMRQFSFSLGVRCEFCHVAKDSKPNGPMDFASDKKPAKKTARAMLHMVEAINQDYIRKMGRTAPVIRVECVTCHRQLSLPKSMNAVLAETIEKKDVQAAIALYRDLRAKDAVSGKYDFGETSLNILTENLLKQEKAKEAAAIMELNVEVNAPPSGWASSLLAMAHVANHETEKARAEFRKILEQNPQNEWAKKQLEQLDAAKP